MITFLASFLCVAVTKGYFTRSHSIQKCHTLLAILSSFLMKLFSTSILVFFITLIPFALFTAIIGLEIAVSFIQAFVFSLLVCSYIKDAEYLH